MNPALYGATLNHNLPTIDLHGVRLISDAAEILEREAFYFSESGERTCRIIYGIGTGKMRLAVIEAIENNPMFGEYEEEESGGSLVVLL